MSNKIPVFLVYETGAQEDPILIASSLSANEAVDLQRQALNGDLPMFYDDVQILVTVTGVLKAKTIKYEDYLKFREIYKSLEEFIEAYEKLNQLHSRPYEGRIYSNDIEEFLRLNKQEIKIQE